MPGLTSPVRIRRPEKNGPVHHLLAWALWLVIFYACVLFQGIDSGVAAALTAVAGVSWGVSVVLRYRRLTRVLYVTRRQLWGMMALRLVPLPLPAYVIAAEGNAGPVFGVLVGVPCLLVLGWGSYVAVAREERLQLREGFAATMTPGDSERLVTVCETELGKVGADPAARGWLELNLAHALHNTLLGGYRRGNLERAAAILTRLTEQDPDPLRRFLAADLLVGVANTMESSEGDLAAMERAVERLVALADPVLHVPGVVFRVELQRMELAFARFGQEFALLTAGLSSPASLLGMLREALRFCEAALRSAPAVEHVDLTQRRIFLEDMLSKFDDQGGRPPRFDEIREALDRGPRYLAQANAPTLWLLARLIFESDHATIDDVADAERRVRAALRSQSITIVTIRLKESLASLALARARLEHGRQEAGVSEALDHLRSAYEDARTHSPESATGIAMRWGEIAAAQGLGEEAADGYLRALESARRLTLGALTRGQRELRVREAQGAAAEAAHWLIIGRRYREAVVALESGRALLLTEVMEREQVESRLRERGHDRLAGRYGEVIDELRRLELVAAGGDDAWMLDPAGRRRREMLGTARADWEELVTEIRTLPGFERFLAAPRYREVQDASRITPLVYLVAAQSTGYALTIVGGGDRPGLVRLRGLTSEALQEQVGEYRAGLVKLDSDPGTGSTWEAALSNTLRWLSETITDPLVLALGPLGSVTLIPTGALTGLPLHATDAMLDALTVTYSPNARVLSGVAGRPAATGLDHLLVADPGRDPANRLTAVDDEVAIVRRWFRRSRVLTEPEPKQVIAEMPRHSVYHFACHGVADHRDPLRSGLAVGGDHLTVKDLLTTRLPSARLAVLSACESGVPGMLMSDEVTGLPGALLQAGVPGVVGALWKVDDFVTLLMIMRFHELWLADHLPPPEALRQAQRWIRDSTLAQFLDAVEGVVRWPHRLTRGTLRNAAAIRPYAHPDYWAAFTYTGI